ncbi:MAG: TlpA disulfide reductase family protein [Caldimonas sp.]
MNRRLVILGAAGLAAAAIGAGTAWRRARDEAEDAGAPEVSVDVWAIDFKSVDGVPMPMAALRGRPLLLNFWATWCGPCVVEMPLLDRFAREQPSDGWRVLALAVDQPDPVRRFIAERTLKLPVAIAGAIGLDLSRQLGNVHGGLPFTAAFDSAGKAVQRRLGAVSAELLAAWKKSTI